MFENHLNPVMLVFIAEYSQMNTHAFKTFCISQISNQQDKGELNGAILSECSSIQALSGFTLKKIF